LWPNHSPKIEKESGFSQGAGISREFETRGIARRRDRPSPVERPPVKRHRGEPGHTRDTRDTRTHKGTQTTQTNLTNIQTQLKDQLVQRCDTERHHCHARRNPPHGVKLLICMRVCVNANVCLCELTRLPLCSLMPHSPTYATRFTFDFYMYHMRVCHAQHASIFARVASL
jgi:hypothetical protein